MLGRHYPMDQLLIINDHVAMWLRSCVQGSSQENTSTAIQTEEYITQGPKLN